MSFISIVKLPKNRKHYRKALEVFISQLYNTLNLKKNICVHIRDCSMEDMDEDDMCWGTYEKIEDDIHQHRIEINKKLFELKTPIRLFKTVCHEMWHAYQSENKKALNETDANRNEKRLYKKYYKAFRKLLNETRN
jgi:hypothetical protein